MVLLVNSSVPQDGSAICVSIGSGKAPSHYLNQYWLIVNRTFRNKLRWNSKLFINENAFENVVCETAAILSRWKCLNVKMIGGDAEGAEGIELGTTL